MTDTVHGADAQASLEAVLKDEIFRMYEEIAEHPEGEFHFYHGREGAEMFGYETDGFTKVRSVVVPSFRFRKTSTQNEAEAYGVKAVLMTALKPE